MDFSFAPSQQLLKGVEKVKVLFKGIRFSNFEFAIVKIKV
jgi:hypothetical protein